ncbi:DNA polymerase [Pasteurella canis]|uniref:DNA polymerase n=1 Tax=Pasteurella canis TaxID=753 RepID=UPI001D11A942|nr:DNA polymerase [Pasteurella canis]
MKPTKFKNLVYLDVETYFDREYSLSKMTMTEYIRDPRFKLHSIQMAINDGEIQYFDTDHIEDALVLLRNLDNWALVAQNTAFDAAILNWRCGVKPSFYYDTMSMSRGFWPTESASLKELAIRLFPDDNTMRKGDELINFLGVETLTPEQHVVMARYGNQDVHLTREIFKKLVAYGYPEEELYQIHMVIRMYVEPSFVINRPLLETAIEEDVHETETAVEKALTMVKEVCKTKAITLPFAFDKKLFSSNQRFAVLLKDALDIEPPIKLNAKGAPTYAFGKRDVPFIKMRDDYPEFEAIFDARELVKSTIAASRAATMLCCSEPSELNPDGMLPVPLKYYGTATGRYSGQDSINLQNLQRKSKHRLSLTAPKNHLVFVADSSNIEARVNACFSGQNDLVKDFRLGRDIYSDFATEVIFGYQVSKALEFERGVGKVSVLGLGYNMGWPKFQYTLQSGPMGMDPIPCTEEFAKKCVYGYRERYPMITQNWQIASSMITQMLDPTCDIQWGHLRILHNCILMPNGLWLSYPGLRMQQMEHANGVDTWYEYWNGKFWKKIYGGLLIENICQATAGLIIKESMNRIDRWLVENDLGRIVLQVHDEIICVARSDRPDFPPELIQQNIQDMMCVVPSWMPNIPLAAEGGFANEYSK